MLDNGTKRKIDNARNILVGKVPDPKSQVEQITIALIYKFMDDMDKQSEEWGGEATFFSGKYKKYSWSRIFDPKLGGFELINIYGEALIQMNQNPNIPQLFRDIFKNAYLPYRDPETLKSFLKEINEFKYDHSEQLGNAYEYLLSVLSSQGDAGQFRTPRHIIDFMVEIVRPEKKDTVLDPACGTAGFLISSYKHILNANADKHPGDKLTPDERKRMLNNFIGYDISPDMARLSLVNMYLHGFADPNIIEYDALTSEERWNDTYDVILANPPFMSPKGGIRPHKRFSIQAKRSEVLFVDYIAEHLNPNGRAGVIVPEGIIFQSQTAYKNLRKMLVEDCLWAVVSLPAGIFNPYAGVKTSILLMDKGLAKKSDSVLFVKIESDGYGLGAQRRAIEKNDLPGALEFMKDAYTAMVAGQDVKEVPFAHLVEKGKIAKSGDWNFSGNRYLNTASISFSNYEEVIIGDVSKVQSGYAFNSKLFNEDKGFPIIRIRNIKTGFTITKYTGEYDNKNIVENGDLLIGMDGEFNATIWGGGTALLNQRVCKLYAFNNCLKEYVFRMIQRKLKEIEEGTYAITVKHISAKQIKEIKIPLPPIEVQQAIVAEIDTYQKIIDGARQVVDNYKPSFKIETDWEIITLENANIEIIDGDRGKNYPKADEFSDKGYCVFLNTKNVLRNGFNFDKVMFISKQKDKLLRKGKIIRGDIVLTTRGTVGNVAVYDNQVLFEHIRINSGMLIFRPDLKYFYPKYLFRLFQSASIQNSFKEITSGSAQPQLPIRSLKYLKIPVPPLSNQEKLVDNIEVEENLVNTNKQLIEIYEQKIKDKIAEVWGE